MKCDISLKNVEFDYSYYSRQIRLHCPFCTYGKESKSKTYKTLKSLLFHVKHDHKDEGKHFPFSIEEVHSLMHAIALAKKWKLLDN